MGQDIGGLDTAKEIIGWPFVSCESSQVSGRTKERACEWRKKAKRSSVVRLLCECTTSCACERAREKVKLPVSLRR